MEAGFWNITHNQRKSGGSDSTCSNQTRASLPAKAISARYLIGGDAEVVVEVPVEDAAALADTDAADALIAARLAMAV